MSDYPELVDYIVNSLTNNELQKIFGSALGRSDSSSTRKEDIADFFQKHGLSNQLESLLIEKISTRGGLVNTGTIQTDSGNIIGRDQINNYYLGDLNKSLEGIPIQIARDHGDFIDRSEEINIFLHALENIQRVESNIIKIDGPIGIGKSTLIRQISSASINKGYFSEGILYIDLSTGDINQQLMKVAASFNFDLLIRNLSTEEKSHKLKSLLSNKSILTIIDHLTNEEDVDFFKFIGPQSMIVIGTRNRNFYSSHPSISVTPFTLEQTIRFIRHFVDKRRANEDESKRLFKISEGLPIVLSIICGQLKEIQDLSLSEYIEIMESDFNEATMGEFDEEWSRLFKTVSFSLQHLNQIQQDTLNYVSSMPGFSFTSRSLASVTSTNLIRTKLVLGQLNGHSLITFDAQSERYKINPLIKSIIRDTMKSSGNEFEMLFVKHYIDYSSLASLTFDYNAFDIEFTNIKESIESALRFGDSALALTGLLSLTKFDLGAQGYLEIRGLWRTAVDLFNSIHVSSLSVQDGSSICEYWLNFAGFSFLQGNLPETQHYLEQGENLLEKITDEEIRINLDLQHKSILAKLLFHEDPQKSLDILEKVAIEITTDQKGNLAHIYAELTKLNGMLGRIEDALDWASRAENILPDRPSAVRMNTFNNLFNIYSMKGDVSKALKYGQQAEIEARRINDINRIAATKINLSTLERNSGNLNAARTLLDEAIEVFEPLDNQYFILGAKNSLAQLDILENKFQDANFKLKEIYSQSNQLGYKDIMTFSLSSLIDLGLLNENGVDEYSLSTLIDEALEICDENQFDFVKSTLLRQKAHLLFNTGNLEDASELITDAKELATSMGEKEEEGIIFRLKAMIALAQNDIESANHNIEQSISLLDGVQFFEHKKSVAFKSSLINEN